MQVIESYLTKNPCFKTNRKIAVRGLAFYSVGCPQPSAKVFVNNWNKENHSRGCVHAFIDVNDGLVYQTLPWNHRGWHGDANRNSTMISVMLCEPREIKYRNADTFEVVGDKASAIAAVERGYQSAVELFGQLCVKYNFDPMTDIWSPDGGHADPEHLWKGLGTEYTMAGFREDVAREMRHIRGEETIVEDKAEKPPEMVTEVHSEERVPESIVEEPTVETLPKPVTFMPVMRVRIVYDNLRIRSGPGTTCVTTGAYTGKGDFDIITVKSGNGSKAGWGQLADGRGWISLDFAEKI